MEKVNTCLGQGKWALSIWGCSTQRKKITGYFPCDEYSSCKGEKKSWFWVFLLLCPSLPTFPRGLSSRKAGKEPVKCRAQYSKPAGKPAEAASKRPSCSTACKAASGFGGNRRAVVNCSAFVVVFSELLQREGKFGLRCLKSKIKCTFQGWKLPQEDGNKVRSSREAQGQDGGICSSWQKHLMPPDSQQSRNRAWTRCRKVCVPSFWGRWPG